MSDKGLSVGENSKIKGSKLSFLDNTLDIAVKDGSSLLIEDLEEMEIAPSMQIYLKKTFYNEPKILY